MRSAVHMGGAFAAIGLGSFIMTGEFASLIFASIFWIIFFDSTKFEIRRIG